MKWFKHISDSLDDPFIFDLMDNFGADGYLVFFGTLEIYSREFKPEPGWKLIVNRSYLRQKFHKRQDTIIIKCLNYIATHGKLNENSQQTHDELMTNSCGTHDKLTVNSCKTRHKLDTNCIKVFENSGKWDVTFDHSKVIVFIPKFTQIIDDWTGRKLRSKSEVAPKKHKLIKNKNKEEEIRSKNKKQHNSSEQKIAHEPHEIFITLTLNNKSEYPILKTKIPNLKELYPNVDIEQEFRKMKGWCNSNPTKRKTVKGIERFINTWLSKAQDSGPKNINYGKGLVEINGTKISKQGASTYQSMCEVQEKLNG